MEVILTQINVRKHFGEWNLNVRGFQPKKARPIVFILHQDCFSPKENLEVTSLCLGVTATLCRDSG